MRGGYVISFVIIIDRFEGEWAVLEHDGRTFNFPKTLLPADVREGDVLKISVTVDRKQTAGRRKAIEELADNLFED